MKKRLLFLNVFIFLIYNCLLIEPVTLIIQNNSDYDIKLNFDKGIEKDIEIKKNKGDFFLFYPDNIKITIIIDEIGFKKEYNINLEYMKDYKFEFNIKSD